MTATDMQKQSDVINALRFPLILLVVFVHVPINTAELPMWDYSLADGHALFIYISRLISYVLGAACVPCFFVFSGYYAFAKAPERWLSLEGYSSELKKKVKTLLIPYLIWNILIILGSWLKAYLASVLVSPEFAPVLPELSLGYLKQIFWDGPANMPLWYVRDLMVMLLCSPLLYLILRHFPYAVIIPPLFFVFQIGFFTIALTFYSIGLLFAIHRRSIVAFAQHYQRPLLWMTTPTLLVLPFMAHYPFYSSYFYLPGIILTIFAIIALGGYVYDHRRDWIEAMLRLNASVFFVYVAHEVIILETIKGVLARLGLWQYGWGGIVGFFVCGIATTLICLGIYYLLRRYVPALLALLTGGRQIPNTKR